MHRVLPCLMYCQGFWFSQRKNHGWCLKTWGREGIGEGGGGFFLGMPSLKQTLKWPGPIGPWKLTGASSWCGHHQNFNVNGNQRTITIYTIILNYFEKNQFFSFWFRFVSLFVCLWNPETKLPDSTRMFGIAEFFSLCFSIPFGMFFNRNVLFL